MILEIETGGLQNKPVEERIYKVCESGDMEDKFHIGNIIPNSEFNEVS